MENDFSTFEECSLKEQETLDRIADGVLVELCDPEIVKLLKEKSLIEDYEDQPVIPALVWSQWKHFKEITKWKSSSK